MKLLIKLIFREAWYHRSRISLAVIATMAMSAMIVWLIGSIDLVILQFEQDGEHYLGHYQVAMIPGGERQPVSSGMVEELRNNALVVQVTGARQIRSTMAKMADEESALRRQRAGTGLPMQNPVIVGIDTTESPFELEAGRWFNNETEGVMEGVIGTAAANSLQVWGEKSEPVKVGDTVICRIKTIEYKVKIVGLVEQKLSGGGMERELTPAVGALYVSMETAAKIQPFNPRFPESGFISPVDDHLIDYFYIRLRDGANVKQFKDLWEKHFAAEQITMKFIDADDIQNNLNKQRRMDAGVLVSNAASLNSIIIFSTLVSILIVFTALSMGVNERAHVFAMLRTVGMPRWKIAILIFGESIILCLLGWIGGMVAGWFVLQLSVWLQPDAFGTRKVISLGMKAVLTAGIAAMVGSLLAAMIPAWRGANVQPLEGMNRGYIGSLKKTWFVFGGSVGALLLIINPFICYYEPLTASSEVRQFLYTFIGLPTQLAGFVLLTPLVVLLVEFLFTPLLAAILKVRKELLAKQLSSNLWRTFGTATALCVGLGVYSFLEIAGYSMLVPFTHSKTLPNTLVTFLPTGLPDTKIAAVQNTDGVDAKRFVPIALEQPLFATEQAQQFLANGMSPMQANAGIVIFGLNISEAFEKRPVEKRSVEKRPDGSRPLVQVDFVEGTLGSALEKLKTGERYCIVPDSFAFRANLHIGDKVKLVTSNGRRVTTNFLSTRQGERSRVRGTKSGDTLDSPNPFPKMGEGTAITTHDYEICGVVSIPGWLWMAKLSGVRKHGYRSGAMMFAPYEIVKKDFHIQDTAYFWFDRTLDVNGKPTVSDEDLERSLQKLADEKWDQKSNAVERPMVKVSSREYLTSSVSKRADQVIQAAARMPLILLAISSIGMMGTIAASVRTRRFELGVLRCLGVTRFGLIRLILAEALLISIAAMIISIAFGVIGGWCFIGLARYVSFFGSFVSPLTIPFYYLSIGIVVTLLLCSLAAVFPAIAVGRTEPAELVNRE